MIHWAKFFCATALSLLCACATHPPLQTIDTATEDKAPLPPEKLPDGYDFANNPPMTFVKNGKTLSLVRVMDGGACKNNLQGASGSFLVYADLQDIERIKRAKSPEIFKGFEDRIQTFSSEILEKAVDQTNLDVDPFSLGDDDMQQKLAAQLTRHFLAASSEPIAAFTRETTLTIEVAPFPPSLVFYQKGCDVNQFEH